MFIIVSIESSHQVASGLFQLCEYLSFQFQQLFHPFFTDSQLVVPLVYLSVQWSEVVLLEACFCKLNTKVLFNVWCSRVQLPEKAFKMSINYYLLLL